MTKLNLKRVMFTFMAIALLSPIMFSYQNFKHLDVPMAIDKDDTSLNDALIAALKNAAEERKAKQIALNLTTDEEKTRKRTRKPTAIGDRHEFDTRTDENLATDATTAPHQ